MKREKQRQIKELKHAMAKIVKEHMKPYGFKKKDGMIWCVQNNYFFTLLTAITVSDDDQCYFCMKVNVKPMYADDLLWDVMDMQSNKEEPLSLRAAGAFALFGVPVIDTNVRMESLELFELDALIKDALRMLSDLLQQTKGNQDAWFEAEEKKLSRYYQDDALRLMMLLQAENYAGAMAYISKSNSKSGGFKNNGCDLFERVMEYCRRRISA